MTKREKENIMQLPPAMAIKYRVNKGFREFGALNKLLSRATRMQFQKPYIL